MLEDFRTLKQGDEFNFDFSKHPEILIAGGVENQLLLILYQCDMTQTRC